MKIAICITAVLSLLITACQSNSMRPVQADGSSVTKPIPKTEEVASERASADTGQAAMPNRIDIKTVDVAVSEEQLSAAELAKRQIFFDFDSDAIRQEYNALLASHAKYLTAHPQTHVVLQGNTDERGTHEYNLALGQRRSAAVKNALAALGIKESQMETISYGEERSKQNCGDDDCFQYDRRVDIVYKGQ